MAGSGPRGIIGSGPRGMAGAGMLGRGGGSEERSPARSAGRWGGAWRTGRTFGGALSGSS